MVMNFSKKRALDDALYFASLQAGAKIDGYSTVNSNTALQENLLVRPSSSIKDFVIIEERKDKTHYIVKIKAILVAINDVMNCSNRDNITLSFFRPYFNVSSRLPAYSQNFPALISSNIYENIQKLDNINLKNLTNFHFSPDKILNKPIGLDYESLVEGEGNNIRSGNLEFIQSLKFHQEKEDLPDSLMK